MINMTNIQTLQEKVQKSQETVEKRKATIVHHEKQLAKKQKVLTDKGHDLSDLQALKTVFGGKDSSDEAWKVYEEERWELYEIESKMRDIVGAERRLQDAETIMNNWKSKLDIAIEKERFLNDEAPQVIKDFLEKWKQQAYDWHIKRYNDYQAFKVKIEKDRKEVYAELGIRESFPPRREQEKILKEKGLDYRSVTQRKADFAGQAVLKMDSMRKESERLEWLEKVLEAEKKVKMLDLINRINAVVGTITDANGLKIAGGNLNGVIIGEKDTAKIETIGAGGWNIQCFHYRTLIHKVK